MRGRRQTWDEHPLIRKNFRQDHGAGPEELPYKKRAKKVRKRVDHKHEWIQVESDYFWDPTYMYIRCAECNVLNLKKTRYVNKMRRKTR